MTYNFKDFVDVIVGYLRGAKNLPNATQDEIFAAIDDHLQDFSAEKSDQEYFDVFRAVSEKLYDERHKDARKADYMARWLAHCKAHDKDDSDAAWKAHCRAHGR